MGLLNIVKQSLPSAPGAGLVSLYPDTQSVSKLNIRDDSGNVSALVGHIVASSTADQVGFATDGTLAGSVIGPLPVAGGWRPSWQYYCEFDMTKTAAGTAAPTLNIRMGTAGNATDASVILWTLGAGTAAVDTGIFQVWLNFRSVGSGTSAVVTAVLNVLHTAATGTGLTSTADKALQPFAVTTSAGFNSTTQTYIGLSFNGGASFSGTCKCVQSQLICP